MRLRLLGRARPTGQTATVILLEPMVNSPDTLGYLFDWALPLARMGVYLKIFLAGGLPLPWNLRLVPLQWTEEILREMLAQRMQWVGEPGGLNPFRPPDVDVDINDRLASMARGSPRQLILLGNKLLARVGTHPEQASILPGDLEYLEQTYGKTSA